ncbi:hypothetical protein E3J62_02420, partial [candidate division TA06 bacterium]
MKRTSSILFALVLVLSLVLIIAGPMASPVQAKSSGPNSGSTAADDDSIGTVTWDDVNNALDQDDSYAGAILTQGNNTSHYLEVTGFGFDVSSGATIQGIVVEVDRRENTTPLRVFDNSIKLVKGGVISGTDRSTGLSWPSSDTDTYVIYGNSTDLWGLTWDPADINDSGFGVAISAVKDDSVYNRNAFVDHIRITVYYSVPEYYLTMVASPPSGGEAFDDTNDPPYEEGEEVNIRAEADAGYEFVEWTSVPTSGGTPTSELFDEPEEEETVFTMPAYNVTVTANFQVETGPEVPPTVTTVAASGITRYTATLNMNFDVGDWSRVWLQFAHREYGAAAWHYTDWTVRTEADEPSYHVNIGGLTANTTYEFQAQLDYPVGKIDDAAILNFTTDELYSPICFIATAAYGTPSAEQIDVLREFRDSVLLESTAGSVFVSLYYQLSPPVADFIAGNELLRTLVREFL